MTTAPSSDVEYLKSLRAVRDRARIVFAAAQRASLNNFDYDGGRMSDVADLIVGVISRDFGPDRYAEIPPHGRWQHFDVGCVQRIAPLMEQWKAEAVDTTEITRRLIDLFFVSVLLDAGAGDVWTFKEPGTDQIHGRSEGIAVASLHMFTAGAFSSTTTASVDGDALNSLTEQTFRHYFQISDANPMVGTASRLGLLNNLGTCLQAWPDIFGETGRPGNLVDYLLKLAAESKASTLDYEVLWSVLQKVLLPAWPKDRTHVDGVPIGDAWPLKVLERDNADNSTTSATRSIQPFHKLTQWLAYSLSVPFVRVLGFEWKNQELGTGLPEYRNGGLFVDMGVLRLKDEVLKQGTDGSGGPLPSFPATSDVIVEWRAMTVALLDELHGMITGPFAEKGVRLSMAQMLEAGTWKSGRELAAKHRPATKSSPILIEGDGTLF